MNHIPAGYLNLGDLIMHISELKQHTSDVERFQRHLPLMADLVGEGVGSPATKAVYAKIVDPQEFTLSLKEYGDLLLVKSGELAQ